MHGPFRPQICRPSRLRSRTNTAPTAHRHGACSAPHWAPQALTAGIPLDPCHFPRTVREGVTPLCGRGQHILEAGPALLPQVTMEAERESGHLCGFPSNTCPGPRGQPSRWSRCWGRGAAASGSSNRCQQRGTPDRGQHSTGTLPHLNTFLPGQTGLLLHCCEPGGAWLLSTRALEYRSTG